jgi:hypothetical protein
VKAQVEKTWERKPCTVTGIDQLRPGQKIVLSLMNRHEIVTVRFRFSRNEVSGLAGVNRADSILFELKDMGLMQQRNLFAHNASEFGGTEEFQLTDEGMALAKDLKRWRGK